MCRDGDCPVIDEPPPGEAWCQYRLGLEYARWVFGYPMEPGRPRWSRSDRLPGVHQRDGPGRRRPGPLSWRRMGDLNPRGFYPNTISNRAH